MLVEVEQHQGSLTIRRCREGRGRWYEVERPERLSPSADWSLWDALAGQRLPGSTTITGLLSKDALPGWYGRVAVEAMAAVLQPSVGYWVDQPLLDRAVQIGLAEPERVRHEAAEYGTRAHALIAQIIEGQKPIIPPDMAATIEAFEDWRNRTGWRWKLAETLVASHTLRIGTQIDGIADAPWPDPSIAIVNWKTGNGIYAEAAIQAGAEWTAYGETFGVYPREAWVVRLGKTKPAFYARRVRAPDAQAGIFACLREVYDAQREEVWTK